MAEVARLRVTLPDDRARSGNPLVWTIVTTPGDDQAGVAAAIYSAAHRTPELLRKSTTTYGTPLRVALLRGMNDRASDLVRTGAVLPASEQGIPSLSLQLERFLNLPINEPLRTVYRANAASLSPRLP